jgi:hypothetical protein
MPKDDIKDNFKNQKRLTKEELDAIEESNKPLKPLPPLPSGGMGGVKGGMVRGSGAAIRGIKKARIY